jgi:cyclophilin family peptidyl-prolyl cis-trans isomerase
MHPGTYIRKNDLHIDLDLDVVPSEIHNFHKYTKKNSIMRKIRQYSS